MQSMKSFRKLGAGLFFVAMVGLVILIRVEGTAGSPANSSWLNAAHAQGTPASFPDQQVQRGAYLARVGDCVACHTAAGGKPFAGGLPIASPIGTIYTTNITPDKATGIGNWSYEDFAKLMRTGQTREGYTVYPAMPYPSYARLTDEDLQALYAYFMKGVQPVGQANRDNAIPWPLSMRFPLTVWRWLFAPSPLPFQKTAGMNDEVARGAYLVQGLGHCGSCHTARGVALQEKALTDADGVAYLAGGDAIEGWVAPSLRNEHGGGLADWSESDIAAFLKTGRNDRTASFGAMNEVVTNSTQYFTDADLHSIAAYLKTLGPVQSGTPPYRYDDAVSMALFNGKVPSPGAQVYIDRCAACHRSDGKGAARAFPALAGNPVLQTSDATSAIHIVLSGGAQPATKTAPSFLAMAPYADILNDQQVADVVTFIQTSWGNRGSSVTAADVAKVRKIAKPMEPAAPAGAPAR